MKVDKSDFSFIESYTLENFSWKFKDLEDWTNPDKFKIVIEFDYDSFDFEISKSHLFNLSAVATVIKNENSPDLNDRAKTYVDFFHDSSKLTINSEVLISSLPVKNAESQSLKEILAKRLNSLQSSFNCQTKFPSSSIVVGFLPVFKDQLILENNQLIFEKLEISDLDPKDFDSNHPDFQDFINNFNTRRDYPSDFFCQFIQNM
ncbi:hypothetical protein GEMRC1_005735 [Eukaryota sp. GEM-RC1]